MRKFTLFLLFIFVVTSLSEGIIKQAQQGAISKSKGRILMIIAHRNFRDEEYFIPKKIFEKSGYKVITASSSLRTAKGMLGGKVRPDILLKNVKIKDFEAIIFVGGSGSTEYWDSKIAHKLAREAVKHKKILAAICLAPGTLAKSGVLKNKKATIFVSGKNVLEKNGAIYINKNVVIDKNIITANGPAASEEFAKKILNLLKKGTQK